MSRPVTSDVMADHRDDVPENERRGQCDQDDNEYPVPELFSFLAGLPALQLVLAEWVRLGHGSPGNRSFAVLQERTHDERNGDHQRDQRHDLRLGEPEGHDLV